jgi:hypothetical protein
MQKRMRSLVICLSTVVLFLILALPVPAIVWCHDYSLWRVTGEDAGNTSPAALRSRLGQLHYKKFPFTNAARLPQAQGKLRPGDVVIFGDAHSGVVNDRGLIDHFVQKFGASGTRYSPEEILKMDNFHRDWTLLDILNFKRIGPQGNEIFPYRNAEVEVWRPTNIK